MNIDAQNVIESLRYGIPPTNYVRHFTVGRIDEITQLKVRLKERQMEAILLKANYGAGKSHLLRFIREIAIKENYLISIITLDAKSGIRFNRMDQILGTILRNLEFSSENENKGISTFFDYACKQFREGANTHEWNKITNNKAWDFSCSLESPSMFLALRAWYGNKINQDMVKDWLYQGSKYKKVEIAYELIEKARFGFLENLRIDRPLNWKDYQTNTLRFDFKAYDYDQSWRALRDINKIAVAAGFKGFVILFDEFKDIVYNIRNISHKESAFENLFRFFLHGWFDGMSFFAVTPGFIQKCIELLKNKDRWSDEYYLLFNQLPSFEMSPLDQENL
jgi:hypothetical protein